MEGLVQSQNIVLLKQKLQMLVIFSVRKIPVSQSLLANYNLRNYKIQNFLGNIPPNPSQPYISLSLAIICG